LSFKRLLAFKNYVIKDFYFEKSCSFELAIHQRILKKNVSRFPQKYEAAQPFSTLMITRNVSNQHI